MVIQAQVLYASCFYSDRGTERLNMGTPSAKLVKAWGRPENPDGARWGEACWIQIWLSANQRNGISLWIATENNLGESDKTKIWTTCRSVCWFKCLRFDCNKPNVIIIIMYTTPPLSSTKTITHEGEADAWLTNLQSEKSITIWIEYFIYWRTAAKVWQSQRILSLLLYLSVCKWLACCLVTARWSVSHSGYCNYPGIIAGQMRSRSWDTTIG